MKLTIDSICLLSSIIDKMEIDDKFVQEILKIAENGNGKDKKYKEDLQKQIGIKIVLKITSKLYLAKDELVEFIAKYKEISKEEAKKEDVAKVIKELVADKDFTSFFKQKLMPE